MPPSSSHLMWRGGSQSAPPRPVIILIPTRRGVYPSSFFSFTIDAARRVMSFSLLYVYINNYIQLPRGFTETRTRTR